MKSYTKKNAENKVGSLKKSDMGVFKLQVKTSEDFSMVVRSSITK
jgi:hypothetical protein